MRYHAPYTIFPRTLASGKVVFYYRVYLGKNRRSSAFSTGCTSEGAARLLCQKLYKEDKLLPNKKPDNPPMKFSELSPGFWDWNGDYVQARLRFSDPNKPAISRRYAEDCALIAEKYLLPAFGKRYVDTITPQDVETFSLKTRDEGLSGKRCNDIISVMRTMLFEAYRAGQLSWNPKKKGAIRSLGHVPKKRGRLTGKEVRRLFAEDAIKSAWKGHLLYRVINLVAAATGCRQGEILAIHDEDIFDDYLHISKSYTPRSGLKSTKTGNIRDVPIPAKVRDAIEFFLGSRGYVFSFDGGQSCATGQRVTQALYAALEAIGITDREERNITFHSWRHWLNTVLRAEGIPDDMVRRVTGHESEEMTARYTKYVKEELAPIAAIQERII